MTQSKVTRLAYSESRRCALFNAIGWQKPDLASRSRINKVFLLLHCTTVGHKNKDVRRGFHTSDQLQSLYVLFTFTYLLWDTRTGDPLTVNK